MKLIIFFHKLVCCCKGVYKKKGWFYGGLIALLALTGGIATPWVKDHWKPQKEKTVPGWKRFVAPEGGFKVHFPEEPTFSIKELNLSMARRVITYHDYISYQDSQVSYAVSYVQLPAKFRLYGAGTVLKAALDVIPENGPLAKGVKQEFVYHDNHPALNFSLRDGEERVEGRLVLIKGSLFKLVVRSPLSSEQETQSTAFFDSFMP